MIALILLATQLLDFQMSSDDKKQTGVYKLSDKQKARLEHWIHNHYAKREVPLADPAPAAKQPVLSESLQNGKFIRLSDDSLWSIAPQDTAITQSWITPVEILVVKTNDPQYPYKLTNSLTGSSVRAKKVDTVSPQTKS